MNFRKAFAQALRTARVARNMTQEDFSVVSSRTYMSALERGLKSPTLDKLNELANVMGTHPASLIMATYSIMAGPKDASATIDRILSETRDLLMGRNDSAETNKRLSLKSSRSPTSGEN